MWGFLVLNVLPKPAHTKGVIVGSRPSLFPSRFLGTTSPRAPPHPPPHLLMPPAPGFRAAVVDSSSPSFPHYGGICSLPGHSLGGTPQPPAGQDSVDKCPSSPASSETVLRCILHSILPESPTEMSPSHPQCRLINAPFLISLPSLSYSPPPLFLLPEITYPPQTTCTQSLISGQPQ